MAPAQLIARRLAESLPEPFTAYDVRRKGWAGLDTIESAERALEILSEHNWVKGVDSPGGTPGRPTTKYFRNPAIAEVAK